MASIKQSHDGKGRERYIVFFQNENGTNGRKIFRRREDACEFVFNVEHSALKRRTINLAVLHQHWSLKKLIEFFIGRQYSRMMRNELNVSTYRKQLYKLMLILEADAPLLKKSITEIDAITLSGNFNHACVRMIYSAYNLLMQYRVIDFNPVVTPEKATKKVIDPPDKVDVMNVLEKSEPREQLVCALGAICGLRIGEALAVTYKDVSQKYIVVNKQVTQSGVTAGLKRAIQRRVPMSKAIWQRLDQGKIGSDGPLIANTRDGGFMKNGYSTSGKLKKTLSQFGIKTFHHLRHFAVSRLAEKGFSILKVSRMIGHSKASTTSDIYGHLFDEWFDIDGDEL